MVWVAGVSGAGKSSVCEVLKAEGRVAVDADWEGFSQWVHRTSGEPVLEPPYPVPPGWLDQFGWRVRPEAVEALAQGLSSEVGFLCGGFENASEVWGCFDQVVCLAIDEPTLRYRLANRTTNDFGKHPEELRAALDRRGEIEGRCRSLGATIIDATQPLAVVAAQVVATADGL